MRSTVVGRFFYLYLIEDLYSRRIVGWEVHEQENDQHSSTLVAETCAALKVEPSGLTLHSDNGSPMKGATMLATLQRLGIVPSFSRPRVSDDNPYVESLFRTLKYRPSFPNRPFSTIDEARAWVADFVRWYNESHQHSGLQYVTPDDRYNGLDQAILAKRHRVYQHARALHPERWSRHTRNWKPEGAVSLNPRNERSLHS